MKYYKRLILIILLIFAASGAALYYTGDINTLQHLNAFRPWAVVLALAFLSLGMYFDSMRLVTLAKMAGERITLQQAVRVILSNYFLAMLTPGATGGPVAQVLFLRKLGLPTGHATVMVLVRTILSIVFLIICLPFVLYLDPAVVPWLPPGVMAFAAAAVATASVGGMWFVRTRVMKRLVLWVAKRFPAAARRRLLKVYFDIRNSVTMLAASPQGMVKVFAATGLSLLALYAVVPALFLGLGIPVDWVLIVGRMVFLNLLLYFAPTPGGTGVAEGMFILLFSDLAPPGSVGLLAVAWRIVAEYLPFAAGLYVTVRAFGKQLFTAG